MVKKKIKEDTHFNICFIKLTDLYSTICLHFILKKKKTLIVFRTGVPNPALLLAIDCPAKFRNSNQTHLKQLIKFFRIAWKLKTGVFD